MSSLIVLLVVCVLVTVVARLTGASADPAAHARALLRGAALLLAVALSSGATLAGIAEVVKYLS